MGPQIEIQIIAVLIALACSLPGVFLVLRHMAMMTDAITHTILLGIVLAFFVTHDLSSPLLIVGAALMGVFTVWLTETLRQSRLLAEDAAIGVVFPFLFSIAIILISRNAGSVHLDTDAVLLGELAFAPFDRMRIAGLDVGAKAIYSAGVMLFLNLLLVGLFFKELKLTAFDAAMAAILGFSPVLVHYGLMTMVSLTAVTAFQAVGSILVVAFMIGPPLTAYLLTYDLKGMLWLSGLIGTFNSIVGYQLAAFFDVSIAGSMAVVTGLVFLMVFVFSPRQGLLRNLRLKRHQKLEFAQLALLFHLLNHEGEVEETEESARFSLASHLDWSEAETDRVIAQLKRRDDLYVELGQLKLTNQGRSRAQSAFVEIFS